MNNNRYCSVFDDHSWHIFVCMRNSLIIMRCLVTVNVVPPIAGEFFLVENGSVGAQERCTLVAFATIVAHVISLTAGFYVGIHTRHGRHITTVEVGRRHFMVDRIIVTGHTGNLVQILTFFLVTVVVVVIAVQTVLIVSVFVVGAGVVQRSIWLQKIEHESDGTQMKCAVILIEKYVRFLYVLR